MKQCRLKAIIILAVLLASVACGKKGPPFLPKPVISKRVEQLKAERENENAVLKGQIVEAKDQEKNTSYVVGCRVYHAFFTLENPPCQGCPIEYQAYNDIEEEVITEDEFSCMVRGIKKKGIHFFKVRLIGPQGEMGKFSNRAKLIIED